MEERWIGEIDNISGSYKMTICDELYIRRGGYINAKRLYQFKSRLGKECYITDQEVIADIERMLELGDSSKIYEYLYKLVFEKFGINEFLMDIGYSMAEERAAGFRKGKRHIAREMRKLLGLGF